MNLDREKARAVVGEIARRGRDAFVTMDDSHVEVYIDRLEGCVVPDPRLARIAALPGQRVRNDGLPRINADDIRAVLGGGPA